MGFATTAIHSGQEPDQTTGSVTVPIYQTSTYCAGRAHPRPSARGGRHPPVPVAQQAHRGRHEERPDDARVEGHRDGHAQSDRLDQDDVGERERAGHDHDDEGGGGHDPAAPLEAAGDRLGVVPGPIPDLLHPGQEEDLVVHRQPEQDAEQDDRLGRLDVAQRLEPQDRRQVAVLEDPDQRPERGHDRERVHDQRLGRQDDRSKQDEQDEVGRHEDEQGGPREAGADAVDHVDHVGRAATDQHGRPDRWRQPAVGRSQRRHQRPGLVGVGAVRRGQREQGQVALGGGRQARGHESIGRTGRGAVQQDVLVAGQAWVDIDVAIHAPDPGVGRQAPRIVVQRRRRWPPRSPARSSGWPGRAARTGRPRTAHRARRRRPATGPRAAGSRHPGR